MNKEKIISLWNRNDRIHKNGVGKIEWILFAVIAVFCYIFFCHQDILITATHSMVYLDGHIKNFYSACKRLDGTYGANYLPTTFLAFAVWNIPMKLLGIVPKYMGDWSVPFIMWNKLLPTIFYMLSSRLVFCLVKNRFGFSKQKAVLTAFLFMTTPMAFFSQFIFCQYDIFVVFFMLLGMYHFFKEKPELKDWAIFTLSFGIATTIKYFAIVIFAVLLLLRVKNILKIMISAGIALTPFALEFLAYFWGDRNAFMKSVFDFKALSFASDGGFYLGSVKINLLYVVGILLIAFAYFIKPASYDELVKYGFFFASGVCFAVFGFMYWYPQWLLFMAPFWVISTMLNKNYRILLWVDALLGVVLDVYIVNAFVNNVDSALFRFGVLHDKLMYNINSTLKMKALFVYQDKATLFTVIVAIFLIGFVIKHPKFDFEKLSENIKEGRFIVNVRFLAFSMAFILAASACLPSFLNQSKLVWSHSSADDTFEIVTISKFTPIEQYTRIDAKSVNAIYLVCDEYTTDGDKKHIIVDVIDTQSNQVVAHGIRAEKDIVDGNVNSTTKISFDAPFAPDPDVIYCFKVYTDSPYKTAIFYGRDEGEKASLYRTYQRNYPDTYMTYKGERFDDDGLVMRLSGEIPDTPSERINA